MFALDIRCHCSITEKNIMLTACPLSDNLHTLVFTLVAMWLQYLYINKTGVHIPTRSLICNAYVVGLISWAVTEGLPVSSLNRDSYI